MKLVPKFLSVASLAYSKKILRNILETHKLAYLLRQEVIPTSPQNRPSLIGLITSNLRMDKKARKAFPDRIITLQERASVLWAEVMGKEFKKSRERPPAPTLLCQTGSRSKCSRMTKRLREMFLISMTCLLKPPKPQPHLVFGQASKRGWITLKILRSDTKI